MEDFFFEMPSLPSLPSDFGSKDEARQELEFEREQLRLKCAASLRGATDHLNAARRTMMLLSLLGDEIIRHGSRMPFAISSDGLIADVRRCDCLGPAKMGFYYESQLRRECCLLVPSRIDENDPFAFSRAITTWNANRSYFLCSTIGAVLSIRYLHFQKRWEGRA